MTRITYNAPPPGRTCEASGTCAGQEPTKECFKWGKLYSDDQYRGYCAAYYCVVLDTELILAGSLNPAANRVHTQLKRLLLKVREDVQKAIDFEQAALDYVDGGAPSECPPCNGECGGLALCATNVRRQLADIVIKLDEEKQYLTSGIACLDGAGFSGGNQNTSGRDVRCPDIRDPAIRPPPGCGGPRMPRDLSSCHQSAKDAVDAEDEAIRMITDLVRSIDSSRSACTNPSQGLETVTSTSHCGCTDDGAGDCIPNTCDIDCPPGRAAISQFDRLADEVMTAQQNVATDPFRDAWSERHRPEVDPVTGNIMDAVKSARDLISNDHDDYGQLGAMETIMDHRAWPQGGEVDVRAALETLDQRAIPELRAPGDRRTRSLIDGGWDLNRAGLLLKSSGAKWYGWALPYCKPGEIGSNPFN